MPATTTNNGNGNNNNTASDVITYIGVPLAVLGVLPILYNSIVTLLNASKIKRTLRHSRLTALTRSDVVNRIIEIELPRYAVTPWDRFQQPQEYWSLSRHPSEIPGGSWTTFNWKSNAIGFKTQRLEYADQLRQPQVDIAFSELIAYLLDLGAIPDPQGWRLLRSTGLWTPVGCVLMKAPDGVSSALSLAPLDDSDGNLSLAVAWKDEWITRSISDLPPYWVSLLGPPLCPAQAKQTEIDAPSRGEQPKAEPSESRPTEAGSAKEGQTKAEPVMATPTSMTATTTATTPTGVPSLMSSAPTIANSDENDGDATPVVGVSHAETFASSVYKWTADSTTRKHKNGKVKNDQKYVAPITCEVSVDGIITAMTRHNDPKNSMFLSDPECLNIDHLKVRPGRTDGMWFASGATAYGTTSQTILWNYRIPEDTLTFARRETVPCGVLVLLGVIDEADTPEWATNHRVDPGLEAELFMRRCQEQRLAVQAEMRLPPEHRAKAAMERQQRENMQRIADLRDHQRMERAHREQYEKEALQSPKWNTRRVADCQLAWLKANHHVPELEEPETELNEGDCGGCPGTTMPIDTAKNSMEDLRTVAGVLLYRMVREPAFANRLCRILDRWRAWAEIGGMKYEDMEALRKEPLLFAQATVFMGLITESTAALEGTLALDLQECLRLWRNVRLG